MAAGNTAKNRRHAVRNVEWKAMKNSDSQIHADHRICSGYENRNLPSSGERLIAILFQIIPHFGLGLGLGLVFYD